MNKFETPIAVVEQACCPTALATPLSEQRAAALARDFAALADPVRLRLLSLVASASAGEACVCELVEPLERSQPTVSHHLKILADAGLIVGEKRGRWVWYRPVRERLAQLRGVLDDAPGGQPTSTQFSSPVSSARGERKRK